ncbi:hypothetical protein GOP47_0028761 [Adiantum capillus-veneris]|nr:hypothetical protein GOP47_0028761 [Adiantum capillus-veneris]
MTHPAFMRAPMAMTDSPLDEPPLGPVGILWDMENCPIPGDVHSDAVAGNIRLALKVHPAVDSFVTIFSAYGDFNQFPRRLREGCQRTGINLIDVPNGRKDAADKAILADMFLFALDNPPPCTILLISGDVDFAPALHKLGQRGYTVLLAVPAAARVASSLCNASQHVWDWPSVARGEGFVPVKALCHQHILRRQPGDMEGLKKQLVTLLKFHGGVLNFTRVFSEYRKMYGRPLFLSEYGSLKLYALLIRLGKAFKIVNTGSTSLVVLNDCPPTARRSSQVDDLGQQGGSLGNAKQHEDDDLEEVILLRAKD